MYVIHQLLALGRLSRRLCENKALQSREPAFAALGIHSVLNLEERNLRVAEI